MPGKLIFRSMVIVVACTPAAACAEHYAISTSNIAQTISRAGVQVSPDQVMLPTGVVATTANPMLKVRSVEKLGNRQILARIECLNSDQCLPFFVDIQVGEGVNAKTVLNGTEFATLESSTRTESHPMVVRSGATVMLMLEGAHVHIRIPVVCLEGGASGQTIRVTDKSHRLIYSAQVIDASFVKGKLQ